MVLTLRRLVEARACDVWLGRLEMVRLKSKETRFRVFGVYGPCAINSDTHWCFERRGLDPPMQPHRLTQSKVYKSQL
jgi:hypothetical protein